jgi:hypothetical protein
MLQNVFFRLCRTCFRMLARRIYDYVGNHFDRRSSSQPTRFD